MSGTPASSSPGITGFIEIFEGRLNKMKLHLKAELSKDKHERNRKWLKSQLRETKALNKTLKEMRNASAKKCPHCGEKL
jgi:hypothetical protein